MRISSRSKAIALLLLVSCQYSFAALDVALCSKALCYPKVTGQKWGSVKKGCPEGYELSKDVLGKAICSKKVLMDCPPGMSLKDGKCCGSLGFNHCSLQVDGKCPEGSKEHKDCSMPAHPLTGRTLKAGNPIFNEVNLVGTQFVPNVILPKPAFSLNIAPPKPVEQPKINIPSMQMPQIILPEPPITFTMPEIPKLGPEIKFEGNPNIIPQIIPILPEPAFTVTTPPDAVPTLPKFNRDVNTKTLTLDFSKVGPSHTVDINVPAMPNMVGELTKLPDVDVFLPDTPKVLDFSGLGPKTSLDVKLPQLKLPKQGSITIVNNGINEPQILDLSALGPKNQTQFNIVLPRVKGDGGVLNVIVDDDKIPTDYKFPGNGGKHNTVINVPEYKEIPTKKSSLVVDIKANPALEKHWEELNNKKVNTTKISVTMPDIDLTKALPKGPDVVVDLKPLVVFKNHTKDFPKTEQTLKRVNITMKDIELGRWVNDTTVVIKPTPLEQLSKFLHKRTDDSVPMKNETKTQTVINLPESILPQLHVPKDKTEVGVTVPFKFGLLKNMNSSADPDAVVNVYYKEEWSGGNASLPNPIAKVATAVSNAVNAVTTVACPTKCCKDEPILEKCLPQPYKMETVAVQYECEKGCTYDLKNDKCLCSAGTVADCPAGMAKCSIGNKGVCAPDLPHDNKFGLDACLAFKAVCSQPGLLLAQTCKQ